MPVRFYVRVPAHVYLHLHAQVYAGPIRWCRSRLRQLFLRAAHMSTHMPTKISLHVHVRTCAHTQAAMPLGTQHDHFDAAVRGLGLDRTGFFFLHA